MRISGETELVYLDTYSARGMFSADSKDWNSSDLEPLEISDVRLSSVGNGSAMTGLE